MKNVFLVTESGERHEDHIPIGFYTYDKLVKEYRVSLSEENLISRNGWAFDGENEYGGSISIIHVKENKEIPST